MNLYPMFALFSMGGQEIILLLGIALLLFGGKKLPELAKGLGQGIREFKKATDSASEGMRHALEEVPPASRRLPPPTAEIEHTVSQVSHSPKL